MCFSDEREIYDPILEEMFPKCECMRDCRCICHRGYANHIGPCCGPGSSTHSVVCIDGPQLLKKAADRAEKRRKREQGDESS